MKSNRKLSLSLTQLTTKEVLADLQHDHTHTVSDCFHLGLCVLLHLSVLFDCPSTATSTYGLGPNQFLLFSFSFAERTTRKTYRSEITHCHYYILYTGTSTYIYRHIYLHIAAALTVPDIYENVYLWLAIGPSWLIHNNAGFVATPKLPTCHKGK